MAKKRQSQLSVNDQLKELIIVANREGLYDAADFITTLQAQYNVEIDLGMRRKKYATTIRHNSKDN